MDRTYRTLEVGPAGTGYEKLLDIVGSWCSVVLLVVRPRLGLSASARDVLNRLEPHLEDRREASEWPGTVLFGETADVRRYRLDPEVLAILKQSAQALHDWQQPDLPEDLCLIRDNGEPALVTIAHELDAFLALNRSEFAELESDAPDVAATLVEDDPA